MSLRLRLILAFLALSVVPLGAMTWYSYAGSARAIREAAEHESDLLASELTQRMQIITAQVGDRMERLAEMDVEGPAVADASPPTPSSPADAAAVTAGASSAPAGDAQTDAVLASAELESRIAQRLGEAAMFLNNVELRGLPNPTRPPQGAARGTGSGRSSSSAVPSRGGASGRSASGTARGRSFATRPPPPPPPGPAGRTGEPPPFDPTRGPRGRGRGNPSARGPESGNPAPTNPSAIASPTATSASPGAASASPAGAPAPASPAAAAVSSPAPNPASAPAPPVADGSRAGRPPAAGSTAAADPAPAVAAGGTAAALPAPPAPGGDAANAAAAPVRIDLGPLRRRMYRELSPGKSFEQMTPEERQRLIADVNQRMAGVVQGLELGASELQRQADEAKRKSAAPASPAAANAASPAAPQRRRTLTGDRLDIRLEPREPNGSVRQISAQVNLPDMMASVFQATPHSRGEVPFAVGKDGHLYTRNSDDRTKIQTKIQPLSPAVLKPETKAGTTRLADWIIVTTDGPSGSGLKFGIARPLGDALQNLRSAAARTAGLGLLFICITLIGVVPLSAGLTKSMTRLSDGVRKLAKGDYSARVPVTTHDEIGALGRAFNQMAEDVERHERTALQQERIKRELELGREIQHQMLPHAPLAIGAIEAQGISVAAGEVGGDFFNYFMVANGQIALLIGDVSGKGVGAALLMANVQASLRTRLTLGQDLTALVVELDHDIFENTPGPVYSTLFVGLLDQATGVLRYVNAGHPLPIVLRKDGVLEPLASSGLPVGLLAGRGFVEGKTLLSPGDRLFCYTDGCIEAENERGEPFGLEALEQQLVSAGPIGPAALLQHMEDALRTFRGATEPFDDATMLVVRAG